MNTHNTCFMESCRQLFFNDHQYPPYPFLWLISIADQLRDVNMSSTFTRRFSDLAKTYSNSSRKSSFTTSSYSTLGPSKLFKIGFNVNSGNYTEFWSSVRLLAGNDCLYPQSYDATEVTGILRNSKIIYADLFTKQTSLKLKMRFEGNQSAIFKIMLV